MLIWGQTSGTVSMHNHPSLCWLNILDLHPEDSVRGKARKKSVHSHQAPGETTNQYSS